MKKIILSILFIFMATTAAGSEVEKKEPEKPQSYEEHIKLGVDQFLSRIPENISSKLDYSPESLIELDKIISSFAPDIDSFEQDELNLFIANFGNYILLVAAKEFDGGFQWVDKLSQPVFVLRGENYSIGLITQTKVANRMKGDEADNIPFFYSGFQKAARNPEGKNVTYM